MPDKRKRPRSLFFNALVSCFKPCGKKEGEAEKVVLLPDEIEAFRLMDLLGMYQEDAAAEMDISRPTLSRIIKKARQKIALALIHGKTLEVQRSANIYKIAFPSDDTEHVAQHSGISRYIVFFTVQGEEITEKRIEDNPVFMALLEKGYAENEIRTMRLSNQPYGIHATRFLPQMLDGTHIFVVRNIGENIKNRLELLGISIIVTKAESIQDILKQEGLQEVTTV